MPRSRQRRALRLRRRRVFLHRPRRRNAHPAFTGRLDGAEPAFYPADETGAIAEGAQPVTPEEDFEAYVKGYDVRQPAEIPEIYQAAENGVYAVEDREGNKLYRTYGVKERPGSRLVSVRRERRRSRRRAAGNRTRGL